MIISRTPYRLSFFGGGTDYPAWSRAHGGAVLAASIDKYCYLTCRFLPPFFEHRSRVVYSRIEMVQSLDEIAHPAAREILRFLKVSKGVEIHHDGDLPARSGMGSSSAFTVGLLHALHGLHGVMPGKRRLAEEAIYLEQEVLKETVGCQDQVMTSYGGFNHVVFLPHGEFAVHPVTLPRTRLAELNDQLMLVFTGIARTASTIAESYVADLGTNERHLRLTRDLVDEGLSLLSGKSDLTTFGGLLHEAWQAKRSLGQNVSNTSVDDVYEAARRAGALGGKLLGAGGGGFLLLFVPPERQKTVRSALSGFTHVPFRFEFSGTQVIFSDFEEEFEDEEQYRAKARDAGIGSV